MRTVHEKLHTLANKDGTWWKHFVSWYAMQRGECNQVIEVFWVLRVFQFVDPEQTWENARKLLVKSVNGAEIKAG
jgi:hypothetical protein